MGWWTRYLAWRQRNVWRLVSDGDGFVVNNRGQSVRSEWRDIVRVTAFKRDLFSVDLVCLMLESAAGMLEVNEQMDGYAAFEAQLEQALGIGAAWKLAVLFPAFETNAAVIYPHGATA